MRSHLTHVRSHAVRAARNTRAAWTGTGVFAALLVLLTISTGRAADHTALAVHIVDYAHIGAAELARANDEAARLWARIDVSLAWPSRDDAGAQSARDHALDVFIIVLDEQMAHRMIVAEHRGDGVLGRAVPEALRAYIFYDRVKVASGRFDAPQGVVLGEVFAHELGHLLLGHNHSPSGLMRAEPDFGSRQLAFAPGDAIKIRAGIVAQMRDLDAARMMSAASAHASPEAVAERLVQQLRETSRPDPSAFDHATGQALPSERRRMDLYAQIRQLGPAAFPAISKGLRDPDVGERRNVATLLVWFAGGFDDPELRKADVSGCLDALVEALRDSDPQVSSSAADALLLAGLKSSDGKVPR